MHVVIIYYYLFYIFTEDAMSLVHQPVLLFLGMLPSNQFCFFRVSLEKLNATSFSSTVASWLRFLLPAIKLDALHECTMFCMSCTIACLWSPKKLAEAVLNRNIGTITGRSILGVKTGLHECSIRMPQVTGGELHLGSRISVTQSS